MRFTLKDYQEDALRDVLDRLRKARKRWHDDGDKHSFSLTATTGAGKTVMAAAVFEALFFGNEDLDFEADPGAVVIWFSDDPSLNVQSMWRLQEASDKLTISNLITIENSFSRDSLECGKVYFLNTQKLGKNSLLVRGADAVEENGNQLRIMPDMRAFTIWDIIKNTIEDPDKTLYLVLDEAHRGMKESRSSTTDGKQTIVKQLINGAGPVSGIPVVWGISATVDRFNKAMEGMEGRSTLPNVVVDPKKVQESGLLKDTLILDVPDENGDFSTVLLRRGTDKLKEISEAWAKYAAEQNDAEVVVPLMVLQVPNSPDRNEIGKALDTIFDRWPELSSGCVANVFGDHKTESFGGHSIPYIEPQRVQESTWVRIVIAKDAISTGWDCPRAEVMVSFRAASDKTHITQLLGRMVRAPLARRIPGNDRLNSVDCVLPKFDKKTVQEVVASLMSGADAGEDLLIRRILINPVEMKPNPRITEAVWKKLIALPSQGLPKRQARPVKRLTALAHELAADGLLADAGKLAHAEMHKRLDSFQQEFKAEIQRARQSVLDVEGKSLMANLHSKLVTFDDFVEAADYVVIEDAYRRSGRIIGADLATTYSEHIASSSGIDDDEEALIEAHTNIAALGLLPLVRERLDAEAEQLANEWLATYRDAIRLLSDERKDVYRQIREMSIQPLDVDIARPSMWMQPTSVRELNGSERKLDCFEKHLLCDDEGLFPVEFGSSWEKAVLVFELKSQHNVGWYRNPDRATQDSLGITYEEDGELKILRPDFVFFSEVDGVIEADIVDPHGVQFADALPKLKGLANYAELYGSSYRRINAVAKVDERYRVLDLKREDVRVAVRGAVSARSLYASSIGSDYAC